MVAARSPRLSATHQAQVRSVLSRSALVPIIPMVAIAALLYGQVRSLGALAAWVDHSDQVIAQARRTERLLIDRETGMRGYDVTGAPLFLEPYERGGHEQRTLREQLAGAVARYGVFIGKLAQGDLRAELAPGGDGLIARVEPPIERVYVRVMRPVG